MKDVKFLRLVGIVAMVSACSIASEPTRQTATSGRSNGDATTLSCSDPTDVCFSLDGTPPPPYVDTTGSFYDGSATPVADAPVLRLQYFMNVPALSGWVSFRGQTAPGVSVSPNARITYTRGVVAGRGTIRVVIGSSLVTFDLAKAVSGKSSFNADCSRGCASLILTGTLAPKEGRVTTATYDLLIAPPATVPIIDHG